MGQINLNSSLNFSDFLHRVCTN